MYNMMYNTAQNSANVGEKDDHKNDGRWRVWRYQLPHGVDTYGPPLDTKYQDEEAHAPWRLDEAADWLGFAPDADQELFGVVANVEARQGVD